MNEVKRVKFEKLYLENSRNGVSKPSKIRGEGFPMVNMKEIFAYDIISNQKMERVPLTNVEYKNTLLKVNDLLFARQSLIAEGAGKVSIIDNLNEETTFESHLIRVRLDEQKVDSKFYYYYFKSPQGKGNTQSIVMQVAAAGIRGSDLAKLKVPFIPLLKQKKIASILSAYDDLIENNNQRITLLEEMAEEIYKEWFLRFRFPGYKEAVFLDKEGKQVIHGKKGAIPKGWENTRLKNHIEYYRGKSYSSAELRGDEGLAMLNLKNVKKQGGFRRDGLKYFEGKYNSNNEAYSGDIIMAVTDMTQEREIVGRVARVPDMGIDKFIISMDLIRIEPIKLPKLFTYCFFRFSRIGYQLKEFANGANVLHLTPSLIEFQKAIIPAIEICEDFEKIVEPMITEIDLLNNKNQILQETRDLLLPRLISGKLSVEELEIETEI
jgi:type I restriction enzyme S subunit